MSKKEGGFVGFQRCTCFQLGHANQTRLLAGADSSLTLCANIEGKVLSKLKLSVRSSQGWDLLHLEEYSQGNFSPNKGGDDMEDWGWREA